MENRIKVILAKFSPSGVESRVFLLTLEEITEKKKEGWIVKEQLNNYRPGFYTKKKEFLLAKGKNF